MTKLLRHFSLGLCLLVHLPALESAAQVHRTSLLTVQSIQVDGSGVIRFDFQDLGTGSTNYIVEFAPTADSTEWTNVTDAVLTDLPGGYYQASAPHPGGLTGFYRVRGLGATESLVTAGFDFTRIQADEGTLAVATIIFNGPFVGTVRYALSGTAESGDYVSLSGEVEVDGTTVRIPIQLSDNHTVQELRFLTLTLEPGSGYLLGAVRSSTIQIMENDAPWQGTLVAGEASVGFTLLMLRSNGVYQASLKSEKAGLFPTQGSPASVAWTPELFSAGAEDVQLPPESTLLNTPVSLSLSLLARQGVTNQSIAPTLISGEAVLLTQYHGLPHLNTTNYGTFLLTRPAIKPSSREIPLSPAP